MDKVAVLVPCYNEELTVAKVISDFRRYLPSATIYVYDNNSTDNTRKIALLNKAVVINAPIQGKGAVVKQMFDDARKYRFADYYIMVDGDDTYPANEVYKLLELCKDADMVVGDRLSSTYFTENTRPFHNLGNRLVRFMTNLLFCPKNQEKILDIMTGYRCFSQKFIDAFHPLSDGFQIETEMSAFAHHYGLVIKQTPITYKDRPKGSVSKLSTYKDGFKVIIMLIKLRFLYTFKKDYAIEENYLQI